jgi:hypothetical protein
MGSEIKPIEITDAATTPVVAASSAPTKITAYARPAANRAEQLPDGVEQVLRHSAALQDQPHEGEERDREQRVVRHYAPDPLGQRLQQRFLQEPRWIPRMPKPIPTAASENATG